MRALGLVLIALVCAACANGKETILFATRTNVAIDLDAVPMTTDIGYKRDELVLAPIDGNGKVLPLMTTVGVRASPFDFGANHSFATGDAAIVMSKYLLSDLGPDFGTEGKIDLKLFDDDAKSVLDGATISAADAKPYYFGTNTVLGLGVTWDAGGAPTAVALGYKRKELALVPLGRSGTGADQKLAVASLIATAHSGASVGSTADTRAVVGQTFATGIAATYLATHPEVRRALGPSVVPNYDQARTEFEKIRAIDKGAGEDFDKNRRLQDSYVTDIVAHYRLATPAQRTQVATKAAELGIGTAPPAGTAPTEDEFRKTVSGKIDGTAKSTEALRKLEEFKPN